jgi:hypothetical protein
MQQFLIQHIVYACHKARHHVTAWLHVPPVSQSHSIRVSISLIASVIDVKSFELSGALDYKHL